MLLLLLLLMFDRAEDAGASSFPFASPPSPPAPVTSAPTLSMDGFIVEFAG
jgi:hypothetical protein